MKGFSIEYIFYAVIFVAVIYVGFQLISRFSKTPNIDVSGYNITDFCLRRNNTILDADELKDVIYGFLSEKCNDFYFTVSEKISKEDLEKIVKEINSEVQVLEINSCVFPKINAGNFYINFDYINVGEKISIKRRNIKNGDILMCKS
ncbi:MAG: hypothetical protein QXM38_01350 [Candidatus Aenigmatarchaeota archaeon]